MEKRKLMNLIKKEEGIKLDFKQKLELSIESGRKELAKDVCAIANSRGGRGYIIVGIEDKTKKIIGLKEEDMFTEEQIQQIVSSRCEPPIPISVEDFGIDNKKIAIIIIYDGMQKPYQLRENGAFYIRRGSTTDNMRKEELIAAFEENLSFNIEICPIMKSSLEVINYEIVDRYFASKGIDVNDDNREFLMETTSIVYKDKETGELKATLGGLLVFSDINSLYVPHNMIKIVNRIKPDMDEFIIVQGNLLHIIDECEEILEKIFPINYPKQAIYEGIKNAVLYRDYGDYYKEIQVIINYNSTVVISPGGLIRENLWNSSRDYSKRNMWLYEKLITLDRRKRFIQSGTGFGRMKNAFKNKGKVVFINSKWDNNFKIIYPGVNAFLKAKE